MPINRLRKAATPPLATVVFAPAAAGSIAQGALAASLREAFKATVGADTVVIPGTDKGGAHADSGALPFAALAYDSQRVWSGTQWTTKNVANFRAHARIKITGVNPGDVFQVVLLGTAGGTTSVLALGPWCPAVTDDQGNDQAVADLDEVISPPAGMVIEVHIKGNSGSAVTMKAPSAYSAIGSAPSGPYVAGSFFEVTEVVNAF